MGAVHAAYDPTLHRKVALKVLPPDDGASPGAQARLLREAQLLAQLSHPNVLAVHDVGSADGQAFIALALVEGRSARQWLASSPRTWRQVLHVFVEAGKGLAAAHAAGLVHRDFRLDTILVADAGRVFVTDLGAALPDAPPGTRASPAPELLEGRAASPASDQFAFCAALFEALHGAPPFPPPSVPGPERWQLREPPRAAALPARLRRLLQRGLSLAPEARFASLEPLLEEAQGLLARGWRAPVAAAAALAVLGGAGLALHLARSAPPAPCTGAARRLAGVWDAPAQQALAEGFGALGPFAADAFGRTREVLDGYTQGWVRMHTEACEATRVRGEQSDEDLSLRMACLEGRLQDVKALTRLLQKPDDGLAQQAVKAAHGLPLLEGCANVEALRAPLRPPASPDAAGKVAALRERLSEGRALFQAGRYAQGVEAMRPVVAEAEALGYEPLEAEAREVLGNHEERGGKLKEAEATLLRGLWAAEAGGHVEATASISAVLTRVMMLQARFEDSDVWASHTRSALERLGPNPRIEAFLHMAEGSADVRRARQAEALAHFEKALALRTQAYGPAHPEVAGCLNNIGAAHARLGHKEQGFDFLTRALAVYEKTLGEDHPDTTRSVENLGILLEEEGHEARAFGYFERALRSRERLLGPDHPLVGQALSRASAVPAARGDFLTALQLVRRARAVFEKAHGPDHVDSADELESEANLLVAMERYQEALALAQRSIRLRAPRLGSDHPTLSFAHRTVGRCLLALGKPAQALRELQRARMLFAKTAPEGDPFTPNFVETLGDYHLEVRQLAQAERMYALALELTRKALPEGHWAESASLLGTAEVELARGRRAAARALAERVLALQARHSDPRPVQVAAARLVLSEALPGEERERARQLAESALASFRRFLKPSLIRRAERTLARLTAAAERERPGGSPVGYRKLPSISDQVP
jgi:tetratricopeptide (TPR) repeat protein